MDFYSLIIYHKVYFLRKYSLSKISEVFNYFIMNFQREIFCKDVNDFLFPVSIYLSPIFEFDRDYCINSILT